MDELSCLYHSCNIMQLEKEKYTDNIDEMLWEGKQSANALPPLDDEMHHYRNSDDGNYDEDVSLVSPKGVSSTKNNKSSESTVARDRSPAAVSPAIMRTAPVKSASKVVQNATTISSHSADVGEDRPSHWNRTRTNTVARSSNNSTTANKSTRNNKLTSNVIKVAQIPKPKPLPSQPASLSFGENSRPPSFKPSWLTSTASTSQSGNNSHTQGVSRTQRTSTPIGEERMLIEAIQEEAEEYPGNGSYTSTFRPPPRSSALHMEEVGPSADFDVPFQDSFGSPNGGHRAGRHVSPQRSFTVHTLSTPFAAQSTRDSYNEHDSATKLSRSHSSSTHSRASGGSKAKPGSLKAKLQKVWRDVDANENRIINIPLDPQNNKSTIKSRALDLQDPRSRAVHYVDAQVDQILPDEAPFKVVLLSVLGTWHKHKPMEAGDGVSVVSDPSAPTSSLAVSAVGASTVTVAGDNSAEEGVPLGALVKAYFKADTCVGPGRGLTEEAVLRVYDPHVWPTRTSMGSADGRNSGLWSYVMINTNCWELVELNNA